MKFNRKCIQYFFDASKYNPNQVVEQVELEKKQEFPKQKAKIEVKLNEFGVYVATLIFEKPKRKYIKSLKMNFKNKDKKVDRYEKLISENSNRVYGKYKETREYKPYVSRNSI